MVGLQRAGQLDGLGGGEALVDVDHELGVVAEALAQVGENVHHVADVLLGVDVVAGERACGLFGLVDVALLEIAEEQADVLLAGGERFFHNVAQLLERAAADGAEYARAGTALAAQQAVDGQARDLALDVPQRHVDAGDGVVEHGAVAPVGGAVEHLPGVLDVVHVAADHRGAEVFVNGGLDRQNALGEGGAAEAVEAGFGGFYLDHEQVAAAGGGKEGLYVAHSNAHRTGSFVCFLPEWGLL